MPIWGEMRCSACIQASRYSKVLLRFAVGSIAPGGQIVVLCRCGHRETLTYENQQCDRVVTFRVNASTGDMRSAVAAR